MKKYKLTYKQEKFCLEYILNKRNGTLAALKAGYSTKGARVMACKLLANPAIKEQILVMATDAEAAFGISKNYMTKLALDIAEDKRQKNTSDRNKAIEIINKMQGYNAPEKIEETLKTEPPDPEKLLNKFFNGEIKPNGRE